MNRRSHRGQSHLKTITRVRPVSLKPPMQHLLCIGALKGAWGACKRRLFNSLFFWHLNSSSPHHYWPRNYFFGVCLTIVRISWHLIICILSQSSEIVQLRSWEAAVNIVVPAKEGLESCSVQCSSNYQNTLFLHVTQTDTWRYLGAKTNRKKSENLHTKNKLKNVIFFGKKTF